jgi:cathepsin X
VLYTVPQAVDQPCDALNKCKTCSGDGQCHSVQGRTYRISDFGKVAGEAGMKAEIAARGPIACGICVTKDFSQYAGGIFR